MVQASRQWRQDTRAVVVLESIAAIDAAPHTFQVNHRNSAGAFIGSHVMCMTFFQRHLTVRWSACLSATHPVTETSSTLRAMPLFMALETCKQHIDTVNIQSMNLSVK